MKSNSGFEITLLIKEASRSIYHISVRGDEIGFICEEKNAEGNLNYVPYTSKGLLTQTTCEECAFIILAANCFGIPNFRPRHHSPERTVTNVVIVMPQALH